MNAQIIQHLSGPYLAYGKNGEFYEIDNICDLVNNSRPFFLTHFCFNREAVRYYRSGFVCNLDAQGKPISLTKTVTHPDFINMAIDVRKGLGSQLLTAYTFRKIYQEKDSGYFLLRHKYAHHLFENENFNNYVLMAMIVDYAEGDFIALINRINRAKANNSQPKPQMGSKRGNYSYFRPIRTTNEHRWNSIHMSEYGTNIVRGGRRNVNLPNSWDDIGRSDATNRSWKNKKIRKQWMKHIK